MRSTIVIETEKMRKHGLSIEGYVFLRLLQNAMLDNQRVSANKFKATAIEHNITDVSDLFDQLRSEEFVVMYKVKGISQSFVRVTEKWTGKTLSIVDGFAAIWEKYNLKTNKANSKTMYIRAIKSGTTHAELMKHCERYLKYLSTTDQFQMHLSTWLNPTNKRYEDEYIDQTTKKNGREANIQTDTFNEERPSTR